MAKFEEFTRDVKRMAEARGLKCAIMIISGDETETVPSLYASQEVVHQTWADVYSWIMTVHKVGSVPTENFITSLTPNGDYPQWIAVIEEPNALSKSRTIKFFKKDREYQLAPELIGEVSFKNDDEGNPHTISINTYDSDKVKIPLLSRDHSGSFSFYTYLRDNWIYNNASYKFRELIDFLLSINRS